MKLEWSRLAFADRDGIFDYIAADNPRVARVIDSLIETKIDVLLEFPYRGRIGRVAGTRELVIGYSPYIAAYRIIEDRIVVLRILHGAQQWPDDLPD